MKNKFYSFLLIGIVLTFASMPGLAKTVQPSVKKPTAKPAKTNSHNVSSSKKQEQTVAKKASNSTGKQKSGQTKTHELATTKSSKHDKLTSHQLAETKDSKQSKSKSQQLADAKDSKHGKSKTQQLADAKDSKHGKSKIQQLADAKDSKRGKSKAQQLADTKDSKHGKSKTQQLAEAKNNKHSRKKSHQVTQEVYEEETEEDTTVVESDGSEQTAEQSTGIDSGTESGSSAEIASNGDNTDYSEKNSEKGLELLSSPPKSSQLFFQPLDKSAAQSLTQDHSKSDEIASTEPVNSFNKEKSTPLISSPPTVASSQAIDNDRVHTLIDNGIKSSVVASHNDAAPLPPSTPRERNDSLIQPSQNNKRIRSSIGRGSNNGFIGDLNSHETTNGVASAHGVIESSLAAAGEAAGLSEDMVVELAEIFAWDIDFANNIQAGDQFTIIYEEGAGKAHNKIIAAQFINRSRTYTALRYKDQEGMVSYYTPEGRSTRKAFLVTPVDFVKVSSHFSTHRRHPILNRIRAHKGVDYAARTGTPVKAAGDGVVTFHGTQGGYGRMIVISHGDHYETAYAHLANFRKGLEDGEPVKQGEVIGYVGQSGLATGPHLHYEFRVDGVHRDPENLDSKQAMRLANEEWNNFHAQTIPVLTRLNQAKAGGIIAKNQ
jgi:murein DD-endopeptidase MepM/ murein hydrolase activator NlpD